MVLFSEVYNCYFQVISALLQKDRRISEREMRYHINNSCFGESILYLLPRLTKQGWGFLEKKDGFLCSKISEQFYTPEDFYYYDRFTDRDDYGNPDYRKHFQTLMAAILDRTYVDILYESRFGHRVRHIYLPCRLEYSVKNDCFRLLAVESHRQRNSRVEILNLSRIQAVTLTSKTAGKLPDINRILSLSYYKEPARILIKDRRNALERAMLQFANYEKSTRRSPFATGNLYDLEEDSPKS